MTTVDRILEIVSESGLTAKDFAKKAGIAGGSITDWKTGRSKPSIESLKKIAKYANVELEWLTGDIEFKTNTERLNSFIKNEIAITIWEAAERYYNEYIVPCGISEENINNIIDIIINLNSSNIDESKKMKKKFISAFPVNIQPKVKEFFNIIIKSVISDINRKNTFYYLNTLVDSNKKNQNKLQLYNVPIVGKIAAGQPILAEQNIEGYLPVDPNVYGMPTTDDLFYLRVSGNSMNKKVKNGDFALIHKQDYAEDGDIIVAIVNGDDEATLKKYKRINDSLIALEPQSDDPSYEPIYIDKNTKFQIIGKAIGQFGKF